MGELYQETNFSAWAKTIIGAILILAGIINFVIYTKLTYSEVQKEIREMNLKGIKKILTAILFFIVELFSDGELNIIAFCGIPIVLGLIVLASS